jgi:CheY-like chemotaxis protein
MEKTILVIDDEEMVRRLVKQGLSTAGYNVITAESAENALEVLKDFEPDLIISDISMPMMSGIEFLRKIKKTKPNLSFIFLSGEADEVAKGLEEGALDYIVKPIRLVDLIAKVKTLMSRLESDKWKSAIKVAEGKLEEKNLIDLFKICESFSLTGVLRLKSENQIGEFHYSKGELVKTTLGNLNDDEALDTMMNWEKGNFQIEQKVLTLEESTPRRINRLPQIKLEDLSPIENVPLEELVIEPSKKFDKDKIDILLNAVNDAIQVCIMRVGVTVAVNYTHRTQFELITRYSYLGYFIVESNGKVKLIGKTRRELERELFVLDWTKGVAEWIWRFCSWCNFKLKPNEKIDVRQATTEIVNYLEKMNFYNFIEKLQKDEMGS